MTAYKSWSRDIPERVSIILTELGKAASDANIEITLALSGAALLILTIVERFRDGHEQDEVMANPAAYSHYKKMRDECFLNSQCLWGQSASGKSWTAGKFKGAKYPPESWGGLVASQEPFCSPLTGAVKVSRVLDRLRNAFAHGQVMDVASGTGEIERLVFVSHQSNYPPKTPFSDKEYGFVACSPEDFRTFILAFGEAFKDLASYS